MKLITAKKLTAGALALSMMFAMAVPMAFATGSEVAPSAPVDASVAITKTLKNVNNPAEGAVPNITASMTLDNDGKAVTKPSASGDAQISIDDATVTDGNGAFTVHLGNIKVPGIYTYRLTEKAVNEAGVKQNDKHYTLTIYALNDSAASGTNKIGEYKIRLDDVDGQRKLGGD